MTEAVHTAADKLVCIERELKMRERVYPRWIEQEKMTQRQADREISIMRAIAADYSKLADGERLL